MAALKGSRTEENLIRVVAFDRIDGVTLRSHDEPDVGAVRVVVCVEVRFVPCDSA